MRMDPQQKERMDELAAQMSEKQKAFCDFYVETLNQTEAAILAGYSKKTARTTGSENMTKPYIKEYIDLRLTELEEARIADASEVLRYLTSVIWIRHFRTERRQQSSWEKDTGYLWISRRFPAKSRE